MDAATVEAPAGQMRSRASAVAAPLRLQPADTVLVIDDDPVVQDLMARLLSKEGFRVVTASSGEEGLRLAETLRPGAITLDVMMPGMDGWAVLAALKANHDLADIPVILVTMTDDRNMGYALGASDYMTKPVDPGAPHGGAQEDASARPRASVLIVDDDPRHARDGQPPAAIGRVGCQRGGQRPMALQRLAEHLPTVIVLDLMMPDLDGFDAARRGFAARGRGRQIPVVVVTAKDVTGGRSPPPERVCEEKFCARRAYDRDELLHCRSRPGQVRICSCRPQASSSEAMPKILLVEDNEMNRDMLSRRLTRGGYEVIIAGDGRDGIAAARAETPDLILMDMSLPVMDGWEATRRLKADEATRHIPVIALTAHAMVSDR